MTEKKRCIRCDRGIDAWSRICPFCNWDQTQPVTASAATPQQVAEYRPPSERTLKQRALMGLGAVALLVGSFGVGALINRDGTPDQAPETLAEQAAEQNQSAPVPAAMRADTQLVPVNEPIAPPITSAPAVLTPEGAQVAGQPQQRLDATAVSSVEYAQLAAREQAERRRQQAAIDPRSLTGPAYAQQPAIPRPRRTIARPPAQQTAQQQQQQQQPPTTGGADASPRQGAATTRTRPVPEYQPIPNIRVARSQTVRLDLTVGADGRVKEVRVRDVIPGETARLISTVQSCRFKPATENGVPVTAPMSVDISFRGND